MQMANEDDLLLTVVMPPETFDDWVADKFPLVQRQLRGTPHGRVLIDLDLCEFVSPLPMLILATELMTTSSSGRTIDINLGAGGIGDLAESRARTRKYLSVHGLLGAFLTREDLLVRFQFDRVAETGDVGVWFEGAEGLAALRPILESASTELAYGDSVVLAATTWRLPAEGAALSQEVRSHVGTLLRLADAALFKFKTEARKYRDTTLQRLTQVLLELVENAAEHAYLGTQRGYVGLYARVRTPQSLAASALRAKEVSRSILLDQVLASEGQHQVEVFVVDVGRGLFADLDRWRGVAHASLRRTPLRRTSQILFSRPLSRHDRNDIAIRAVRGSSTGLMHLDAILRHQHDRTRIVTGNEWLAGAHPRGTPFSAGSLHTGGYHLAQTKIFGTVFHVGISPAEIPRLTPPWFASEDQSAQQVRQSVLEELAALPPPTTLRTRAIDIRRNEVVGDVSARVTQAGLSEGSTVVRLSRVADKNLLNAILDAWVRAVALSQREVSALYLCDLGRYQAIDADWIVKSFFKQRLIDWPHVKRAAIFIVTEDLCCLRLDVTASTVGSGPRVRLSASAAPETFASLKGRLLAVLNELRMCDSQLLWLRIATLKSALATPVLVHDVLWDRPGGPEVLPNYLDFSLLTQDQEAARYIRRSLRRLLALFPAATDFALDPLVEAPLHDAKKWLIRPGREQPQIVLVGSLSVSGSTLARHSKLPGTTVVGAIDCIRTPYYTPDPSQFPHVAALLWDPGLPTRSSNRAQYRRLAKSAFIEPIRLSRKLEALEFDESLYQALDTGTLLKVGHWSYGDRHSLIEINTELAIEQSSASEAGAIPWLAAQATQVASESDSIVIAFPTHRLAHRLAHNIEWRLRESAGDQSRAVRLLPLSFLPRVAGGVSRFTPLTLERAASLLRDSRQTVFFVDVGFITNRTLRHAVRQFRALGFSDIRALGLLNRSSAPAFDIERTHATESAVPVPNAFWRWSVPTMGTGSHCALCAALPSLGRVRRAIEESHPDLIPHVERIGHAWRARDVADFWDEYGVRPTALSEAQRTGLAEFDTALDSNAGTVHTSTALVARTLEYLRYSGDTSLPIRLSEMLLQDSGDQAAELLACTVILTGGTLGPSEQRDYALALLRATVAMARPRIEREADERNALTLGLVTLVFAVQSTRCKLEVLPHLVAQLRSVEVVDPRLRLALLALTIDSDESTRVQVAFSDLCSGENFESTLRRNFQGLRLVRANVRETWTNITQAVGRSSAHSQHSVLGRALARAVAREPARAKVLPQLEKLANLLGQCDPSFISDAFAIDVKVLIQEVDELQQMASRSGPAEGSLAEAIRSKFAPICERVHSCLPRYGDRARFPLIYMLFKDLLRDCSAVHGLSFGVDVVLTQDARLAKWPSDIGDYFPLCGHIERLFDEIFSNVERRALLSVPPAEARFALVGSTKARCWLWFDTASEPLERGITIVLLNAVQPGASVRPYAAKIRGLSEFDVDVSSRSFKSDERLYYEVRVRLPSLSSILESA